VSFGVFLSLSPAPSSRCAILVSRVTGGFLCRSRAAAAAARLVGLFILLYGGRDTSLVCGVSSRNGGGQWACEEVCVCVCVGGVSHAELRGFWSLCCGGAAVGDGTALLQKHHQAKVIQRCSCDIPPRARRPHQFASISASQRLLHPMLLSSLPL